MPPHLALDGSLVFCSVRRAVLPPRRTYVYVLTCGLFSIPLNSLCNNDVCLIFFNQRCDQRATKPRSVLSPRCFAESLPCELLWLRLYLAVFLPTHFQGWLLNKKSDAERACERWGEWRGKGRGEPKPIGWACDLTTAPLVHLRRRQWRL